MSFVPAIIGSYVNFQVYFAHLHFI